MRYEMIQIKVLYNICVMLVMQFWIKKLKSEVSAFFKKKEYFDLLVCQTSV